MHHAALKRAKELAELKKRHFEQQKLFIAQTTG